MFDGDNLPHELFLTTRPRTKRRKMLLITISQMI